jgi:hypothetical protein
MPRVLKIALVLAVLTIAFGQVAQANSIGTLSLPGCGTSPGGCPAATYSFNISNTSATLTITIASNAVLTGGKNGNNLIGGVNLGFIPSGSVHVTGGTTTAAGSWTFTTGSLNNNGCGANAGAFVCAVFNPATSGTPLVQGGTYSWTWNYTLAAGATIFSAGSVHIGANYNPANGLIVSQTGALAPITPVPEPSSLLFLGSGLIGFAGVFRRRLTR